MFKSKSVEPPKEISIQAIEEDMLTFAHTNSFNTTNKQRLLEDIRSNSATNDIDINLWFNFFNVFQSQNKELQKSLNRMEEQREELEEQKNELECQQLLLKNDIETCLKNVRKAKSPE